MRVAPRHKQILGTSETIASQVIARSHRQVTSSAAKPKSDCPQKTAEKCGASMAAKIGRAA
jgi:hypothetical protein